MHAQKDVLRQVLSAPVVLDRSSDEGENQVLVEVNELSKRIVVPGAAPFDECALGGRIHPPAY